MNAIEVSGVSKWYNHRPVIQGVTLSIKRGKTVGVLGRNGAGKTTLLSMMSAHSAPTGGTICVNGLDTLSHTMKVKRSIGHVPQEIALYHSLNAYDNLLFFGSLYGISKRHLKERINEMLTLVDLQQRSKDPIETFSGGMKRRINIAAALIHDPDILFLDEPTVGIDLESRKQIFGLISELKKAGKTIIYTTHHLDEAEALCDDIAIIDNGKLILMEQTKDLLQSVSHGIITFRMKAKRDWHHLDQLLENVPFVHAKERKGERVSITVTENTQQAIHRLLSKMDEHRISISEIRFFPPNLETVYMKYTGTTNDEEERA